MEILGVGPSELVFIILIAIIVLGPKEMQKAGKTLGRLLNQINKSDLWKLVSNTTREISNMPRKWMREANLEEWDAQQEIKNMIDPRPRKPAPVVNSKPIEPGLPERSQPVASDAPPAPQGEIDSTDQHG